MISYYDITESEPGEADRELSWAAVKILKSVTDSPKIAPVSQEDLEEISDGNTY